MFKSRLGLRLISVLYAILVFSLIAPVYTSGWMIFLIIEDIVDVVGRFVSLKPDSISCDKNSAITIGEINVLSHQ